MGHERVGFLPRSRQWRTVVEGLTAAAGSDAAIQRVAAGTLQNVRQRLADIQEDNGVLTALGYIVALTSAHLPDEGTTLVPQIDLSADPSPVALSQQLSRRVRDNAESGEYAALATRAAADAIAYWTRRHSHQTQLFAPLSAAALWQRAASGGAFSELARVFFARFIERYLRYFLEREASAEIPSIRQREIFEERLTQHLYTVSGHAFESTKITQSFAAGWFNKHARRARPPDESVRAFFAFALSKLRAELEREQMA